MELAFLLIAIGAWSSSAWAEKPADPDEAKYYAFKWEERWFRNMPIDHFSFNDNRTFHMRYLINTDHWDKNNGPIFFYPGNELRIESFANNTGFMWDIAPEFGAMLVFAEHRYYGKTMPFGDKSEAVGNRGFLSAEQALADFAQFLMWLKATTPGAAQSPVVAFGGSYGAILAAWMRIKYPHVVTGAVSSGGPLLQYTGMRPCHTFGQITTRTMRWSGKDCDKAVKNTWPALRRLADTADGRAFLNNAFGLCPNALIVEPADVQVIHQLAHDAFGYSAMLDYPYETFFTRPLPGYPTKAACKHLTVTNADDKTMARNLAASLQPYFNHTGATKCLTTKEDNDLFNLWGFQCCTELTMPMCNREEDMFEASEWDEKEFSDSCFKDWGVRPQFKHAEIEYGGPRLTWATNIIFANGDLDPWSGGGVIEPYPGMDPSVHVIYIKEAAHHLDLRSEHPNDPIWVRLAREQEKRIIRQWVQFKG